MSLLHLCLICISVSVRLATSEGYTVPRAKIDVLHPKGFSVSIPETQGMQIFAFHGNLNSPMEGLEAGQFSADVLKHKNGRWTFTDKKHEIKPGDILYYWLYVQKDGLGYRRDDQRHDFTDIEVYGSANDTYEETTTTTSTTPRHTPRTTHRTTTRATTAQPPRTYEDCNPISPPVNILTQPTQTDIHHHHHHYLPNFLNTTQQNCCNGNGNGDSSKDVDLTEINTKLDQLANEISRIKTTINHLNDIVTELQKSTSDVGTKLLLTGARVEPGTNLFELVRRVILVKLRLDDLRNDIYSATRTENGVVFDVANALDKRRILDKAKDLLADDEMKILDYYSEDGNDKSGSDISGTVDVRIGEDEDEDDN